MPGVSLDEWVEPVSGADRELAHFLHSQGAVLFGEFTLKSGASSPVFVNVFNAVKDGDGLRRVGGAYAGRIHEFCVANRVDPGRLFLLGPAYKGIPLAAAAAHSLRVEFSWNVRWGYDRKEAKLVGERSGLAKKPGEEVLGMVDGDIRDGDVVVVVDDVITRGDAKLDVIGKVGNLARVRGIAVRVLGIVTLVDRVEGAMELREKYEVAHVLNLPTVARVLHDDGKVSEANFRQYVEYFAEKGLAR
ncbi:MAG: orotate phosphoribosyltransferase [Promethearchaeota archaeon]